MTVTRRTITGVIADSTAGQVITARLLRGFVSADAETVLPHTYDLSISEGGAISGSLPVPDDGAALYEFMTPDDKRFVASLTGGLALPFATLYAAQVLLAEPDAMLAAVAALQQELDGLVLSGGGITQAQTDDLYAALGHVHAISGVTGLQAALDTLATVAQLQAEATARQQADSTKVETTDPRLSDARSPTVHGHAQADVTGLVAALDSKVDDADPRLSDPRPPTAHTQGWETITARPTTLAGYGITDAAASAALVSKVDTTDPRLSDARTPTTHTQGIDTITGLQGALDSKAGTGHTHTTDHGALTGLADDDHPQYQLRTEKGQASGYASLGSTGVVPPAQIGTGLVAGKEATSYPNALGQWINRETLRLPEQATTPDLPAADTAILYASDENGSTVLNYLTSTGFIARPMRDQFVVVRNSTGSTLTKGTIVYISGAFQGAGVISTVAKASAASATTLPAIGAVAADISNNSTGLVLTEGRLDGIDTATSGAADGQRVLVGVTAGTFTATVPTLPNHTQRLGVVIKSHATQGSILIDPVSVTTGSVGTTSNTFSIGDAQAGTKSVVLLGANTVTISATPTANRTHTLPDRSGTVALDLPTGRPLAGGTSYLLIPGVDIVSVGTTALTANQIRYAPIVVETTITIDAALIDISAGATGSAGRIGLYTADLTWQPVALVQDFGAILTDTTGVKTATATITLPPGRYLSALNTDGTPTVRCYRGGSRYSGLIPTLGGSALVASWRTGTVANGPFSATPTAWTTAGTGGTPFDHLVAFRVTSP